MPNEHSHETSQRAVESTPTPDGVPPFIVGIGASAGGLKAIIAMLEHFPSEPGLALVIIQHLDPTRDSSLVEILSKKTNLPVEQVDAETLVEPNHVYIIAPGRFLALEGGCLQVSTPTSSRGTRMPIDFFFKSLAKNARETAIGVILSGTGTDGTVGMREIKHCGGLCVVQDPDEADQPGMPNSVLRGVDVDYTLPAEQIGYRLKAYVDFCLQQAPSPTDLQSRDAPSVVKSILDLLWEKTQQDFRRYRTNTLERRIRRRMGLQQIREISEYELLLANDMQELNALCRDLLIGVTRFFRDEDAWLEFGTSFRDALENSRSRGRFPPSRSA